MKIFTGIGSYAAEFLDLIYPPLCRTCRAPTRNFFCASCADLLTPADPQSHCRHCFEPTFTEIRLCRRCGHHPCLSAPRAILFEETHISRRLRLLIKREDEAPLIETLVSLLIIQWSRLEWPTPDRIATIPSSRRRGAMPEIAKEFALRLDIPYSDEFKLEWTGPFEWAIQRRKEDLLETKKILLLDEGSSLSWLSAALGELWPAFPEEVRIMSIFRSEEREEKN